MIENTSAKIIMVRVMRHIHWRNEKKRLKRTRTKNISGILNCNNQSRLASSCIKLHHHKKYRDEKKKKSTRDCERNFEQFQVSSEFIYLPTIIWQTLSKLKAIDLSDIRRTLHSKLITLIRKSENDWFLVTTTIYLPLTFKNAI